MKRIKKDLPCCDVWYHSLQNLFLNLLLDLQKRCHNIFMLLFMHKKVKLVLFDMLITHETIKITLHWYFDRFLLCILKWMIWIQNFFSHSFVWIVKIEKKKSFFKLSHLQISLFFANGILMAVEQGGIFIVPHLLRHETSVLRTHLDYSPIS